MSEYWRDLVIGEEVKIGDRYLCGREWNFIEHKHLSYSKTFSECSKLTQRKADCVPPIENGCNRYSVDISYFRKTINRELNRGLSDFKPDELARVLARLSVTADKSVIHESEFESNSGWVSVEAAKEILGGGNYQERHRNSHFKKLKDSASILIEYRNKTVDVSGVLSFDELEALIVLARSEPPKDKEQS